MEDLKSKMRQDCWNKALDALAYSYIYSKRVSKVNTLLKWSKAFGFIIPVLLGGIVSGYYNNKAIMDLSIAITTPIALIQLVVSAYLTVVGSDEKLTQYSNKVAEYSLLNSEFEQLANYPTEDFEEYNKRFIVLVERERGISKDNFDLEDSELRMGMKYGLRNYRRACVGCKETPTSMKPTKCDVCGNF